MAGAMQRREDGVEIEAISLRRRYLVVAGLAAAAAPAAVFAVTGSPQDGLADSADEAGRLVVSGRILGDSGRPLAGAAVEVWEGNSREPGGRAGTDADGRLFIAVPAGRGRPRDIRYRVSHLGRATPVTRLALARSEVQRDEAGAWRATFAATVV